MIQTCSKCGNRYDRHGNGHKENCPSRIALLKLIEEAREELRQQAEANKEKETR